MKEKNMVFGSFIKGTDYCIMNDGRVIKDSPDLWFWDDEHEEVVPHINNGYYAVSLDGENYYVHRLVAEAFVKKPYDDSKYDTYHPKKLTVNHKDCNKLNNHKDNLEWITRSENISHGWKNKVRKDCKYWDDYSITNIVDLWKSGYSCQRIANMYNTTCRQITYLINDKMGLRRQYCRK